MFQASNGNNDQAITECQNILNFLKPQLNEPDSLVNYANACNALGNIYYNLNMMQECESTFLEGISVIQNVDINSFAYRSLLRDLSTYYATTNNTEQAINVLNEAKYLYEKNGDIYYNYHTLLFDMAQLYLSNNDYLSALILYDIYKDYLNNYECEEQRVLNDKIILYNYLSFA
jgi:tetratricopeptide (TPR) repeat protein